MSRGYPSGGKREKEVKHSTARLNALSIMKFVTKSARGGGSMTDREIAKIIS